MIDQVAAAFDRQDYKTAAQLLKQLQQQLPDDPWVKLYIGRLQEVTGKSEAAEMAYRRLLRETTHSKVVMQARQGLQRLETEARQKREHAIAQATTDPGNTEQGVLILAAVSSEARAAAAQQIARIMKLDAYTARLHLPSRGWRLYRVGAIGELQVYGQDLRAADIPVFWTPLTKIEEIRVFRVQHLQAATPQATVICQNELDQIGSLTFNWSEVTNRVEGRLPVFEDVVDVGAYNKLKRKEQTQDYAQVIDLHLPQRGCILRFCDWSYQFQQGVRFDADSDEMLSGAPATTRIRWNKLVYFLDDRLSAVPVWSDFTIFAETALEHLGMVKGFQTHIDLFRKAPTQWDAAFQLYSGLVFRHSV
jgi:hypothetical protein